MPRRSARLAGQEAAAAACPLLRLSDDVLEVVGHQISDALRPAVAGALAACNHNLWRVMRAPLATLQPRHKAARALAAKVGASCAELHKAVVLNWGFKYFGAADMATLAMLFSTGALARVEQLGLAGNRLGAAAASALLSGLGCGDAPRLRILNLGFIDLGDAGAAGLAGALACGALPKLDVLHLSWNDLGDEGMLALAAPLRSRPALTCLYLHGNRIGHLGMAALLDNIGAKELKQLRRLDLGYNQIRDAGCVALAAAMDGDMLPALEGVTIANNPATPEAMKAVNKAVERVCVGRALTAGQ